MEDPRTTSPALGDRHGATAWTEADDNKLKEARKQGRHWGPIATELFPNKSANACRKRHERLMQQNQSDWDSTKMEALATAYLEIREQMWTILAARLDEKWQVVESKVCRNLFPISIIWQASDPNL